MRELIRARFRAMAAPRRRARILVVEDDPGVADLLVQMLTLDGHESERVGDGVAALGRLERGAYDAVLSDARMPLLDGPGLFREVSQRWPALAARMAFITAEPIDSPLAQGLEATGAPCLRKPFTMKEVRVLLRHLLVEPWRPSAFA